MSVHLPGEQPRGEFDRLGAGGDAGVVVEPLEVGHELGHVPVGVVRPLHDLDQRVECVLRQGDDRRRLPRVEKFTEPLGHLVDPVGPVTGGVLGAMPALREVEDRGIDRPLERLEVAGRCSPLGRLDEQSVAQVVVSTSLVEEHFDELLGRERAEMGPQLVSCALGQLGHEPRR